jgi:hypothetical protein
VVVRAFPTCWLGLGMRSAFLPEGAAVKEATTRWVRWRATGQPVEAHGNRRSSGPVGGNERTAEWGAGSSALPCRSTEG